MQNVRQTPPPLPLPRTPAPVPRCAREMMRQLMSQTKGGTVPDGPLGNGVPVTPAAVHLMY